MSYVGLSDKSTVRLEQQKKKMPKIVFYLS